MIRSLLVSRSPAVSRLAIGLLLAAVLAVTGCGIGLQRPAAPLRTFHFMAGYKPQANLPFVGAYIAQKKGYFAEQGLDVEITHATGQGEHLKLLLQGSVDVITADAESVLARRAVCRVMDEAEWFLVTGQQSPYGGTFCTRH